MFLWLTVCITFEHIEQPSLRLIVVEGEKGWAGLGSFSTSYSETVSESPILRQEE